MIAGFVTGAARRVVAHRAEVLVLPRPSLLTDTEPFNAEPHKSRGG